MRECFIILPAGRINSGKVGKPGGLREDHMAMKSIQYKTKHGTRQNTDIPEKRFELSLGIWGCLYESR